MAAAAEVAVEEDSRGRDLAEHETPDMVEVPFPRCWERSVQVGSS